MRNMKDANQRFFSSIEESVLLTDFPYSSSPCIRFIKTDADEKNWLKKIRLSRKFKIARDSYVLVLEYEGADYVCIINEKLQSAEYIDDFEPLEVNSGIFTFLGSEGYLKVSPGSKITEIVDNILYDTSMIPDYCGHDFRDISSMFSEVLCFKCTLDILKGDFESEENFYYWLLCKIVVQTRLFSNNNYNLGTLTIWEEIIFDLSLFNKVNYRTLLLAYCAITWDISFLYLYQNLEDVFNLSASKALHSKLNTKILHSELCHLLYEELQWQPKDDHCLEKMVAGVGEDSRSISLIREISRSTSASKWIYKTRNSIVHQTTNFGINLDDDDTWNKAISAIVCLIIDANLTYT